MCQCLNVQRENGHRHGHGDEDVGDEHEQLHILLHYH